MMVRQIPQYGSKSYPKRKLLPQFDMRRWSPYHPCVMRLEDPIDHHVAGTERQPKTNTSLHQLALEAEKQRLRGTCTTCDRTWIIELVIPDQFMGHEGVHQRKKMDIKPGAAHTTSHGPKTAYKLHPNCVVTLPDIEAPQTPYASSMR